MSVHYRSIPPGQAVYMRRTVGGISAALDETAKESHSHEMWAQRTSSPELRDRMSPVPRNHHHTLHKAGRSRAGLLKAKRLQQVPLRTSPETYHALTCITEYLHHNQLRAIDVFRRADLNTSLQVVDHSDGRGNWLTQGTAQDLDLIDAEELQVQDHSSSGQAIAHLSRA
jgi:hypothetical protein